VAHVSNNKGIYIKENKMNKNIFLSPDRETSVYNNNTNTNTIHSHTTYNTTFAPVEARKQLDKQTSSAPLASSSTNDGSAKLNKKEQAAQNFIKEKNEHREKHQAKLDAQAIALSKTTEDLFRIEVTTRKQSKSTQLRVNIDILTHSNTPWQRYTATLQNRRARDITQNVIPKYADWWGYDEAKQTIKDGGYAGKIKIRQSDFGKTKIATKVLPTTACCVFAEEDGIFARVIINDLDYIIELTQYVSTKKPKSMEWFDLKGVYAQEEEMLDAD
jgi:hypothetical protein